MVLQVGEVWDEISRELSLEGGRPISPDQEALSTICKIAEDTAKRIVEEQNSILEHYQKEDIREEKLTYTEVRSKGVEIAYMKVSLKCFSLTKNPKKTNYITQIVFFFFLSYYTNNQIYFHMHNQTNSLFFFLSFFVCLVKHFHCMFD